MQTHEAIGDRAFSDDPETVARLGLSVCRNFIAAGLTPVIKHMPGHGRGKVDSHKDLPHISESLDELQKTDFEPFRVVSQSDVGHAVWGMVAHILYDVLDSDHPASVSPEILQKTLREDIGFKGFLVSDDLDMDALAAYGDVAERAQACLKAGCDAALHCSGELAVMEKIAKTVPNLSAKARKTLQKAAENSNMAA